MKIERTKNASRNIIFGTILRIYQIVIPFIMRTAMIYFMGVQYLGLNSLFSSLLQVLNLAELGVGSAMVFYMYKPIAEDDTVTICALMKLYRIYYRIIGLVVGLLGLAVLPFLPRLIHSDVPSDVNLTFLYVIHLSTTVVSYWLFAYKNALFQAHQREDVISKISIIVETIKYALQLSVLIFLRSYYAYIIIVLICQIVTNIATAIIATKCYPNYKPEGDLAKEEKIAINRKIRDIFTGKFGAVIGTSVDDVVISAFMGLSVLAIYQNYYFILKAVISIVMVFFASCTAGIGNSIITESAEKNYHDFRLLGFLTMWICVICVSCFACLYQPFMKIWVGEDLLLPEPMVAFFCIYFFVYILQVYSCVYKDAAGIWHQDRFRPLVAGIINFVLNISLVRIWGLYAIVASTIISYVFVAMPWVIVNLFSLVFKRSCKEYLMEIIKSACVAVISGALCYVLGSILPIDGYGGLFLRLIMGLVISNGLFIILQHNNAMFSPSIELINKVTNGKLRKVIGLISRTD